MIGFLILTITGYLKAFNYVTDIDWDALGIAVTCEILLEFFIFLLYTTYKLHSSK